MLTQESLACRTPGESWDAAMHLGHIAAADGPLAAMLADALAGATELPFAASAELLAIERESAARSGIEVPFPTLRERMVDARATVVRQLAGIEGPSLDAPVVVPTGVVPTGDAYRGPHRLALRGYLAVWAGHDTDHERAIRAAITQTPSPAAIAVAARLRRAVSY